jgi:hypothetical protein
MRAPKILPWIARRAGISDALALKLWRRAAGEAEQVAGCCDSSAYYGLAIDHFLDLVEEESGVVVERDHLTAPSVTWMWRHQGRMSQLGLIAAQNAYSLWRRQWESFVAAQKNALKHAA